MANEHGLAAFTYTNEELDKISIKGLCHLQDTMRRSFDFVGAEMSRACYFDRDSCDYVEGGELLHRLWEFFGGIYCDVNMALKRKEPLNPDDAGERAKALLSYELEGGDLHNINVMLGGAMADIATMRRVKDAYKHATHSVTANPDEVLL